MFGDRRLVSASPERMLGAWLFWVVRTALTNAGSIAALILTTEALVAEIPENCTVVCLASARQSFLPQKSGNL